MANKPIILQPGSHTAVGTGLTVSRVLWHEPPANGGSARVYDGAGNTIATLFYAGRGKGPEPQQINFATPVAVQGGSVHAFAPGGPLYRLPARRFRLRRLKTPHLQLSFE